MNAKRIKFFGIWLIALAALSAVVMLLWNLLLPAVLGVVAINYWQAMGLFVLSRLLFGGFGGMKMMMGGYHGHGHHMREKWMKMTPEERREFVSKRRRAGYDHHFKDEND